MDPFGIEKRDKNRAAKNSAITGAGATTAGVGFVAGGVPGMKADVTPLANHTPPAGHRVKRAASYARPASKAGRAGILGYRVKNHEGGTYGFKQKATMGEWYPSEHAKEAFTQGRWRGKVAPEEQVIRHMKGGQKAAGVALAAGAAMAVYGERDKIKSKLHKRQTRDQRAGTAVGVGGTGLVASAGVGGLLGHEEKRWNQAGVKHKDAAAKHIPGLKGMSDKDIIRNPHVFEGVDPKTARAAGQARGAATQAEHFAHVYSSTGKIVRRVSIPSAVVAGAGAAVLAHDSRKKAHVQKNGDPFGLEISKAKNLSQAQIDRRKKAQGNISLTTATLGLTGLGLLGAAHGGPKLVRAAAKTGRLKPMVNEAKLDSFKTKASEGAKTVGIISGGVGGVGGYNFASYTKAEARQRKQKGM